MTYEELTQRLKYDPATGVLTWIAGGRYDRYAGKPAGSVEVQGYIVISLGPEKNKNRVKAHRLAWLLMTGSWPDREVDHINGDRADNRWSNLRLATDAEQARNRRLAGNNSTGHKGVSLKRGRYVARITVNGRTHHLGYFATADEAAEAYTRAAASLFGAFHYAEAA
jgi:hypothetical protein